MQTFLPFSSFARSAKALDRQRLGKQRVETLQIARTLAGVTVDQLTGAIVRREATGWANHPAVKMWSGHLDSLYDYQYAVCSEWTSRGYLDTCLRKTRDVLDFYREADGGGWTHVPEWLGDPAFHRSHQSNLIRKDPARYGVMWPGIPNDLEYVWPTP